MSTAAPTDEEVHAAIGAQVARTDAGCWLWQGAYVDGQPDLRIGPRHIKVRRWLYGHFCAPMSKGQVALPLCTRQACVAPQHTLVRGRGQTYAAAGLGDYAGPRAGARR